MPRRLDLSGQTFGKLTAESYAGTFAGKATWNCRCQCGNRTKVITFKLRNGVARSCGNCLTTTAERTPGTRVRAWQSLLGPELTEQLISDVYAEIAR